MEDIRNIVPEKNETVQLTLEGKVYEVSTDLIRKAFDLQESIEGCNEYDTSQSIAGLEDTLSKWKIKSTIYNPRKIQLNEGEELSITYFGSNFGGTLFVTSDWVIQTLRLQARSESPYIPFIADKAE